MFKVEEDAKQETNMKQEAISQKIEFFIDAGVRTSNPK
jgi:hypothetical protein